MCGIVCLTPIGPSFPFDEARHQVGELQQIDDPEWRATLAKDDLRVGRDEVGPRPRHRADVLLVDPQQEPGTVPIVSLTDADKLPSVERVEGVHHADKARARVRKACSSC